jgi:hypothetical protein
MNRRRLAALSLAGRSLAGRSLAGLSLAALTAGALTLAPAATAATNGPVFGLRAVGNPRLGYFVYHVAGGSSHPGAVIISNTGNRKGTVKLYPADGGTGQTTGTVYLTDKQPQRTGAWIKLGASRLTLAPHAFRRVGFTVHVPAGTRAGQWVGGIVAETSAQATTRRTKRKAAVQIHIRNQTIVAVQVDVPGALKPSFDIGSVATGGQRGFQQVLVHLANTGNTLVKPTGTVTVLKSGSVFERLPFTMDTFLPQTAIDYPVLLKKALAPGDYEARISLTYPRAGTNPRTIASTKSFSVSSTEVKQVFTSAAPTQQPSAGVVAASGSSRPWPLIGGVLAALLLLLLLLGALLLRRRRAATLAEPVVPQAPEPVGEASEPVAPEDAVAAEPAEPAVHEPAAVPPRGEACRPVHYWVVAYERGTLGADGIWRFPHRCRNCSLELLATDISDASSQADMLAA